MECIRVDNYTFEYPQGKKALKDVSFSIEKGGFYVLCGCSGCGKSTLLRQLKSVLKPYGKEEGSIYFEGKKLEETSELYQSEKIGFVMQDPDQQIVTDKVWHELSFGLESLGYDSREIRLRVAEMASYFGIQSWFHKSVEELSGGQKQLLNLASIMAMHPALLILDEPTSQLDPIAASDFLATIYKINQELGITVLMTEHRLDEVLPMADKVILMDKGKIVMEDTPKKVGIWTYKNEHAMFYAMPQPFQIYAKKNGNKTGNKTDDKIGKMKDDIVLDEVPLTVREGRKWIDAARIKLSKSPENIEKIANNENVINKKKAKNTENSLNRTASETMIKIENLWFRYEKNSDDVVKGVSLEVKRGELYCLLGGNGTGKSTLISLISRVQKPYRGSIKIEGKDIRKYSDYELYRNMLGVVPQNPQSLFVKKTVRLELYEMIGGTKEKISREYPIEMKKKKVVEKIAELTEISDLLEQHPYDLSGGEQQRLALAKILLLRPKVLLLDEPTKGLDAEFKNTLANIFEKLKGYGVTILMISHDILFCAKHADYCGMLFDGEIVTENFPRQFFAGNSFYTTTANRMVRHIWQDAVTAEDVLTYLEKEDFYGK